MNYESVSRDSLGDTAVFQGGLRFLLMDSFSEATLFVDVNILPWWSLIISRFYCSHVKLPGKIFSWQRKVLKCFQTNCNVSRKVTKLKVDWKVQHKEQIKCPICSIVVKKSEHNENNLLINWSLSLLVFGLCTVLTPFAISLQTINSHHGRSQMTPSRC